ncbi:MAG: penicillin-binding transpeptidase domain-containing protein, partial [Candidatus Omnitrophica bacterium]|nr:penicillin-binding transpeptidase domain-containing protein [Candidatus Omnitrophota bacterium]
MEREIHKTRLIAVFLFFLTLEVILLFRTAYLQVARSFSFSKIARSQHEVLIELEPRRGTIYDRNMYKLAFNINVDSVFAVPRDIEPKEKPAIATKLASILDLNYDFIAGQLKKKKGFVWIKRKISETESQQIKTAKLHGIELIKESKRLYPNGYLAAHIIGFAGLDNAGLEGIELSCDNYLKGKQGFRLTTRDAKRRFIAADDTRYLAPVDGFNIILNVDETIQTIAEQALDSAYKKYNAKGMTIVVMDPRNGEILALANRPSYDINSFSGSEADAHRDRAVTDYFEPGSVFKIVAASGLLEKGRVSFQDKFFCENGQYWVGGRLLHDHRSHGTLTFQEVIEQSSNIGTVKASQRLSKQEMYDF